MAKDFYFDPNLQNYCHENFLKEPDILVQLRNETELMPQGKMQISPLQGQFLRFLIQAAQVTRVLEIGTYTGYSSLIMALSLPSEGKIITCDKNIEWTKTALKYWELAKVSDQIQLILGEALTTLDVLKNQNQFFDLIFIDGDKKSYSDYYEKSLHLLNPHGIIVMDNILWKGKVYHTDDQDLTLPHIQNFNKKISQDPRVEMCLVPLGDGLILIQKKNSYIPLTH